MDYTNNAPSILSLCTGGLRGLERGFDAACEHFGWKHGRTAAYVEIEAFIIQNLVNQMEQGVLDPAVIWSNLKTLNAQPFRNKIDGIFGGYPCQPFSLAGQRKGTSDPRHLWPYIERIIETVRPVFCFFENVSGHLTMGFPEVYASLRNMGYAVEAGIFTAEEVGAPHERERLFILAIMANPTNQSAFRLPIGKKQKQPMFRQPSNDVANSDLIGCNYEQKENRQFGNDKLREFEVEKQTGNNEQCRISESGNSMAETNGIRQRKNSQEHEAKFPCKNAIERRIDKWPARPGQPQHEWEAPRVESMLGFTVNGYNYREDLLRMAGNGVVWQSAEKAFIELLNKHKRGN